MAEKMNKVEDFVKKITAWDHWTHWVGSIAISVCVCIGPPLLVYYGGGLNHYQIINTKGYINPRFQTLNNIFYTFLGHGISVGAALVILWIANLVFLIEMRLHRNPTPLAIPTVDGTGGTNVVKKLNPSRELALLCFFGIFLGCVAISPALWIYYSDGMGHTLEKIHRHEFISPEDMRNFQGANSRFYYSVGFGIFGVTLMVCVEGVIIYILRGVWHEEEISHLPKGVPTQSSKSSTGSQGTFVIDIMEVN
ncbi:OLC1v1019741C2 [Oldenlandia corymbosa var. corymbosa]|nr:OLC1v1019741C2 [Oldenlandia corymbosa var. corymbosa]